MERALLQVRVSFSVTDIPNRYDAMLEERKLTASQLELGKVDHFMNGPVPLKHDSDEQHSKLDL